MKKTILALFLIGLFFALPFITQANDGLTSPRAINFSALRTNVRGAVFSVAIVIVTIMFIISGVLFATSAGDPNQMEKAKKALIYALIGAVIILVSYSFVNILGDWFRGGDGVNNGRERPDGYDAIDDEEQIIPPPVITYHYNR